MNDSYFNMPHDVLQMRLSFNYTYPITDSYSYATLCNYALNHGIKIIAILDDGVVFQNIEINNE
jgi:hypothetical protein